MQANPQGQKSISDQVSAAINSTSQTQIAETVATTVSKIVQSNGLKLKVTSVNCAKFKIDVKQINVNDYVIKSVNSAIVDSIFGGAVANSITATATSTQKQSRVSKILKTKKGKAGLIVFIIILIICIGVGIYFMM
jgi:hypothetical protein